MEDVQYFQTFSKIEWEKKGKQALEYRFKLAPSIKINLSEIKSRSASRIQSFL